MAKNVVIRDIQYSDVPAITVPLASGSGDAEFFDVSDATLSSGNQMLDTVTGYGGDGTKYTGNIPIKTGSDMTASGATVTAPAGYYAEASTKTVAAGSATTPATSITATPVISVNSSTGVISASVSASQSVTPTVSAGYVSAGTAGTVSVSGSDTEQLTVKAAATIMPTTSDQTIAAGQYLTGIQTIKGDANLQAQYIAKNVSIFNTIGTLDAPVVSQDSTTKILSIS